MFLKMRPNTCNGAPRPRVSQNVNCVLGRPHARTRNQSCINSTGSILHNRTMPSGQFFHGGNIAFLCLLPPTRNPWGTSFQTQAIMGLTQYTNKTMKPSYTLLGTIGPRNKSLSEAWWMMGPPCGPHTSTSSGCYSNCRGCDCAEVQWKKTYFSSISHINSQHGNSWRGQKQEILLCSNTCGKPSLYSWKDHVRLERGPAPAIMRQHYWSES